MVNGLILIFELTRIEYGVILLILGIVLSLAGFVAIESNSNSGVGVLTFLLYLLFFSEMLYFSVFGISLNLFGFTLLPRYISLLPSIAVVTVVIIAMAVSLRKRIRKP